MFGFEGTNNNILYLHIMAQWLSWLERRPVTAKVVGSSPIWVVNGGLAQLGEHLPYKQRVIGSSPIGPIIIYSVSWCGGIGRRKGLKIPRGQPRAGSSPATSSIEKASNVDFVSVWSLFILVLKNYEDIQ